MLLGTLFGVISALAYTGTNLTLRRMANTQSLDWAIWVSCWKGVPAAVVAWVLVAYRARRGLPALPPMALVLPLMATGLFMQFIGNVSFQWALSLGGLALTVPLTFATLIGSGAVLGRVVLRRTDHAAVDGGDRGAGGFDRRPQPGGRRCHRGDAVPKFLAGRRGGDPRREPGGVGLRNLRRRDPPNHDRPA